MMTQGGNRSNDISLHGDKAVIPSLPHQRGNPKGKDSDKEKKKKREREHVRPLGDARHPDRYDPRERATFCVRNLHWRCYWPLLRALKNADNSHFDLFHCKDLLDENKERKRSCAARCDCDPKGKRRAARENSSALLSYW
jgi:hypothetical protein